MSCDDVPLLDEAALMATMGGDPETLRQVTALYLEDLPQYVTSLWEAVRAQEASTLAKAAHTLKGSTMNFHAGRAVELARALEVSGSNGDLADATTIIQALERELARLCAYLRHKTGLGNGSE